MYVAPEVHLGGKFDTFLSAPGLATDCRDPFGIVYCIKHEISRTSYILCNTYVLSVCVYVYVCACV